MSADKRTADDMLSAAEKLNLETGVISWQELAVHFARGVVIHVRDGTDLIEVAELVASDDASKMQSLLDNNLVARASDDDARDWVAREPQFWCVVTAPWVLVQEYQQNKTLH